MHSTVDEEAVAALNAKFDEIENASFDDFLTRQGLKGLPQESLAIIYSSFKEGKPMTAEQKDVVRAAMLSDAESQNKE